MKCRSCGSVDGYVFADLGTAPPSNAFLSREQLTLPEAYLPLALFVCQQCWLVQLRESLPPEAIFHASYPYFSSFSSTWRAHASAYAAMMKERFTIGPGSSVIELASNDGCVLECFRDLGAAILGVEPSESTARAAREKGIETVTEFFGASLAASLAAKLGRPDLIIANNVLAHVPDIHDFVEGIRILLADTGVATLEFPHVARMLDELQFDTIYHEHYSYFSAGAVREIIHAHGLEIFDVEEIPTHGGSLRLFVGHAGRESGRSTGRLAKLIERERQAGLESLEPYRRYQERVVLLKHSFLRFLLEQASAGHRCAAYGAAAKGNTLLNYCGVRSDLLSFVVDAAPSKQNMFLPGSRIPVVAEARIREEKPDFIVVLPWNIKEEIMSQLSYARDWGARFVTAVPEVEVR